MKIKLLIFYLFLGFSAYSQDFPLLKKLDSIELLYPKQTPQNDSIQNIMLSHWDNTVFNPYKNVQVDFPFKLIFKDSTYASPVVRKTVVTSRFGWRWGRAHKGIDIDLVTGDKALAMLEGVVRYVGYHSGYGKSIIIRHYNGLETVYAHLSKYNVKINDTVSKGDVIGKGGRSGNARGSHLHFETTYKGQYINPEFLFSFDENNLVKRPYFWVTKEWVSPLLYNSRQKSDITYYDDYDKALKSQSKPQKIYVVQKGDTLYDISKKYNVSISKICKVNTIKPNSTLKIGQQLVL
jgi:murein DD-endopeptidase MepM/ murein hydrolase activator NlpD